MKSMVCGSSGTGGYALPEQTTQVQVLKDSRLLRSLHSLWDPGHDLQKLHLLETARWRCSAHIV